MTRFSEESKQRVREATDLVDLAGRYTELRRVGSDRLAGLCPLHDERTPSFTISPSKQLFKCFGCDAGGDVFSFVQLKEGMDFRVAVEFLARRAAIELQGVDGDPEAQGSVPQRARELVPLDRAAAFYAAHLRCPKSAEAREAREYLASRGLGKAILEQFGVGFAPVEGAALLRAARAAGFSVTEMSEVGLVSRSRGGGWRDRFRGRVMLPVSDMQDRILGFGARKLEGERGPKYVNSPASSIFHKGELLYAAYHARDAAAESGSLIVVEGYIDALAMHQAGFANTVALMGTALSESQAASLRCLAPGAILMLDGDDAGAGATVRAGMLAEAAGITIRIVEVPARSDPAAWLLRDGVDEVRDGIAAAHPAAEFGACAPGIGGIDTPRPASGAH